jgi:small subunit ribosomal protein S6
MPCYEHVFLARQDLATGQVDALTAGFTGIIEAGGGTVAKTEYWGVKSLTYRIKKNRKAHFVLLNIDAPAPAIAELERNVGLSEDVIRYLTVRVDELEAGPSAMMRKVERAERGPGDRPERGDRRPGGPRPPRF